MKKLLCMLAIIFLSGLSTTDAQASKYSEQIEAVAKLTMAEAEGEPEEGQRLVIDVIFNRLKSKKFPNTLKEVMNQPGQFSSMTNGRYEKCVPDEHLKSLVRQELYYRTDYKVLFFNTTYIPDTKHMGQVGHHYFSTFKED